VVVRHELTQSFDVTVVDGVDEGARIKPIIDI
jgi:hypothetical protein